MNKQPNAQCGGHPQVELVDRARLQLEVQAVGQGETQEQEAREPGVEVTRHRREKGRTRQVDV